MKLRFMLFVFSFVSISAMAAEIKEDVKVLSAGDIASLATQVVGAVKSCEGIATIKQVESIEVKNLTDESLDKTVLADALAKELAKKMKIKVKPADAKDTKYFVKATLAAKKTESATSYSGEYQLKAEFQDSSGNVTCWSNASLIKRN
ncbi:MAG: hypothetical protein V4760_17360 [Bdellovibrionota bacterium]